MSWVKLDDKVGEHVKVLRAGPAAAWMWAMGIAYCNRHLTFGFVPAEQIDRLTSERGAAARKLAKTLVDVGLFDAVDGGYRVHDYEDMNPSADKVAADREAAKLRKQAERERKRGGVSTRSQCDTRETPHGVTDSVTDVSQRDLAGARATPTPTPTPVPPVGSPQGTAGGGAHEPQAGTPRLVPRPAVARPHPLDEDQVTAHADPLRQQRAALWLERFAEAHAEVRQSRYVGKPQRDFEPALRLVLAYTDEELAALTTLYLAASGEAFDAKPRTPGHLAHVASMLEERLKEVGQWPRVA